MQDNEKKTANAKEKVIKEPAKCKNGEHTFTVTTWATGGAKQKATHMMCRHCLLMIDYNEASKTWRSHV